MAELPPNVHISSHPCLLAKLSQLRAASANARETKALVHEISTIVGCEALAAGLTVKSGPPAKTPLGYEYTTTTISPSTISLVPILRSGLGMLDAVGSPSNAPNSECSELAILLDPVIATGGTCAAAIQTLKEWGVKRVIVIAVLGALPGVVKAAEEWPEGVEIWVAGVDASINERGMIKPGLGDVGDRLFLTIGK
ncbi:Uracil phosphoribosyltransferase [Lachnellula hyalina]|uniref:Uracil phosphoribosyltransferase n=1 Tax=Lachnellula hyalina TaxID=1316788 RepID=A0A8H8R095_9HELO|nr:Uracil phosphoribosyltransferase [Lachnellula hyalina]TVY25973.1 Uracil phosphoribosyltransferase [Lachnellula hyalina]